MTRSEITRRCVRQCGWAYPIFWIADLKEFARGKTKGRRGLPPSPSWEIRIILLFYLLHENIRAGSTCLPSEIHRSATASCAGIQTFQFKLLYRLASTFTSHVQFLYLPRSSPHEHGLKFGRQDAASPNIHHSSAYTSMHSPSERTGPWQLPSLRPLAQ